jgi:hypothetical protein
VKRKINSWTYFRVMQSFISNENRQYEGRMKFLFFFVYSMFRKKLRKSDLFTRCFLKVNTLLTMWSNCVHLSFIHFLLMLLFRLRLLESIARNVHKNDQINMYIYRRLFNDFDHAHTSFPICKMRFSFFYNRCE